MCLQKQFSIFQIIVCVESNTIHQLHRICSICAHIVSVPRYKKTECVVIPQIQTPDI